jgi:putative cardiolipin synthase
MRDTVIRRNQRQTKGQQARPTRLTAFFWVLTLAVLGGCSSLPADVERIESYAATDTSDTTLARSIAPMLAQHPGESGFHALPRGANSLAARLYLVEQAEKTLDAQYYIWHDDPTGQTLRSYLLAAALRGVRVRLLLDDLDTAGKDEMLHILDAHPNIEVRVFNPFVHRNSRGLDFVTNGLRVNHRMHNKTLTADNQATIFGGRNIGDEYFDAAHDVGFSDLDALGVGAVAQEVSNMFDLYWNSQWVYPLSAFPPDTPITADALIEFENQSEANFAQARATRYGEALQGTEVAKVRDISQFEYEWGKWVLVYDQPGKMENKEISLDTHLAPRLLQAMDAATQDLIIVSPYFVPGKAFTQYLVNKVAQGVRVRIMTNSLASNDVSMVHAGYMRYRQDLLAGGVELYEFKSTRTAEERENRNGIGSSNASLHGKYFAFDHQYVFIGSFNLDGRSVALNTELGVYFESPAYATLLSDIFEQKATEVGYRVSLDEDNDLLWTTREAGKSITLDKEPDTSWWQRFSTGFLRYLVPEKQL